MRARTRRTHDRPVRRLPSALVAVLAASGVVAGAAPAAAEESLAPGDTETVVLSLPDTWAADADTLAVAVDDLVQLENDCIEPEAEAGDDCDDARGELGDKLVATVAWGTVDGGCRPAVGRTPLDLVGVDGTAAESTRFEHVVGVECLVLDLTFPDGDSDDVAQSDSLTFRVNAVAEEVPGEVATTIESEDVDAASATDGRSGTGPQGSADPSSAGAASARAQAAREAATGQGDRERAGTPRGGPAAAIGDRAPAGPMVGRVDAQVSVGRDGVSVRTRAAEAALPGAAMAWSSLLLGAVALGGVAFVLVRRRRTRVAA
jgi:hypothetical protein